MGSSSKQTVGFWYFMGLHFGLCHGPVDALYQIRVGDREAWAGEVTGSESITIDAEGLFGGKKKEGGIVGDLDVLMGGPTQTANGYLAEKIGTPMPAFRGILSAVFKGGKIAANNPYIKPWAFRVKRILEGWSSEEPWYPEKAEIIGCYLNDYVPDEGSSNQDELQPWLVSVDPRNPKNIHEYRAIKNDPYTDPAVKYGPWRGTPEEAQADYVAMCDPNLAAYNLARFGRQHGWSHDEFSMYPVFSDEVPGDAETLVLHFNHIESQWITGYQILPEGTNFCGAIFFNEIPLSSEHWWWCTDTSDPGGFLDGDFPPGVWRHWHYAQLKSWERWAYPCDFNLPGNAGPMYSWDALLEVRRVGVVIDEEGDPDSQRVQADMNPAHILYQCLTDAVWGMGYPEAAIDDAVFTAAADTLYAEDFGLSMIWNKQDTLESFIRVILDHIGGILYVDPSTGKFALKLIRDDYTKSSLPIYGPESLIAASDYQRQAWGETINEITVVYTAAATEKSASITVQDLANIQTQGAVVAQTKQYPGIRCAGLAQRVAMRDLLASSTPLAKIKLTATRAAWALIPGDVFRLSWPEYGLDDVVFRVLEVNRGTLADGQIVIDAVEDIFALPDNTYVVAQPGEWTDSVTAPVAADAVLVEAPYWDLARGLSAADLDYVDPLSGYLEVLAHKPSDDSLNYELWTRTGSADYAERGDGDFCPSALVVEALAKEESSTVTLSAGIDLDLVAVGSYAVIGGEYVAVTAIDADAGTATLARGVLDTVPAAHAAGARILFADGFQGLDETEYADGETVDAKLLTRTGLGELSLTAAPAESLTMDQRQYRPYPPGLFKINGTAYPVTVTATGDIVVTWAHRDRLAQTAYLVTQDESNIGPEAGTTYSIEVADEAQTVLYSATGISTTTETVPSASLSAGLLRVRLWSVRDGLSSWQSQEHWVGWGDVRITEAGDIRITEDGESVITN